MSSNDDEEEPVVYSQAAFSLFSSASSREKSSIKHFDYFLKSYCNQIGIPVQTHNTIPFRGVSGKRPTGHGEVNPCESDQDVCMFWDDVMGCFVEYMGKHARCHCNPKRDRIMKSTAQQRSKNSWQTGVSGMSNSRYQSGNNNSGPNS